jgi:hypothetical protein
MRLTRLGFRRGQAADLLECIRIDQPRDPGAGGEQGAPSVTRSPSSAPGGSLRLVLTTMVLFERANWPF